MYARYASALGTATVMTLSLLYLMQLLIQAQGATPDGADRVPRLLGSIRKLTPPPPPISRDPAPPTTVPLPPTPGGGRTVDRLPESIGVPLPPQGVPSGTGGQTREALLDGPLVLLVQAVPAYPSRLLQQGMEGWVDVRFDVATDGTVVNVRVLRSSNPGFEKSAGAAAERLRFKPRTVNGAAEMTYGVSKRFVYRLDDD